MKDFYIFNDGSCGGRTDDNSKGPAPHGDVGAWCSVVTDGEMRKILYGVEFISTNNRCELLPIIAGLRWLGGYLQDMIPHGVPAPRVTVYSDSEYTVKAATNVGMQGANPDLWAALSRVRGVRKMRPVFTHVARNSLPYMDMCDGFAVQLRREVRDNIITKLFNGDPYDSDPCYPYPPLDSLLPPKG